MSSTWELKEKSTGELTATVEGDTWKDAQKKAFKKLAKKVNLPGFRPGQAPEKLVRKQISSQNILMEAIDEVAGDALSAGIIYSIINNKDPKYVCEFATCASALKHSILGDANLVELSDVERLMYEGVGKIAR